MKGNKSFFSVLDSYLMNSVYEYFYLELLVIQDYRIEIFFSLIIISERSRSNLKFCFTYKSFKFYSIFILINVFCLIGEIEHVQC